MASKKKKMVRLSVYFDHGQMQSFELDPAKDSYKETPKALIITRGDKTVITVDRSKLIYHVVSQFETEIGVRHPAFPSVDEVDQIEFAGD